MKQIKENQQGIHILYIHIHIYWNLEKQKTNNNNFASIFVVSYTKKNSINEKKNKNKSYLITYIIVLIVNVTKLQVKPDQMFYGWYTYT